MAGVAAAVMLLVAVGGNEENGVFQMPTWHEPDSVASMRTSVMVPAKGTQMSAAAPTTRVAVLENVTPMLVIRPMSSGVVSNTSGCPVGQRWTRTRESSPALPD